MAADQVEQFAQVHLRAGLEDESGAIRQSGDDHRSGPELQDGRAEGALGGGPAQLVRVPDQGGGQGGEGLTIGGGSEGLVNKQALAADDGDTRHFGAGSEAVNEAVEVHVMVEFGWRQPKMPRGSKSRKLRGLTSFGATLKLPPMRPIPALLSGVLAALLMACSDPNQLPAAIHINTEDTVLVYSISGTPVYQPSGYALTELRAVRLDVTTAADIAYDITPEGRHVLLPGRLVGQPGTGVDPGLLATEIPFDSIKIAEVNGYLTLDTVAVAVGDVFYLRGRIAPGCYLGLPTYAKLQILALDDTKRTVAFRILGNINCGYRSLEPGLPKR
jgi:hypothetical protein